MKGVSDDRDVYNKRTLVNTDMLKTQFIKVFLELDPHLNYPL